MLTRIRARITSAHLMAGAALFIALGGTAIAVKQEQRRDQAAEEKRRQHQEAQGRCRDDAEACRQRRHRGEGRRVRRSRPCRARRDAATAGTATN